MRQTERQGALVVPEFKYRGNHQKNRPDVHVIEMVEKILIDVGERVRGVSAVVGYDDDRNNYTITFAWEGKAFVTILYFSGWVNCDVIGFASSPAVRCPFEFPGIVKEVTPFLLDLLKKEKHRINEFLNCALGA